MASRNSSSETEKEEEDFRFLMGAAEIADSDIESNSSNDSNEESDTDEKNENAESDIESNPSNDSNEESDMNEKNGVSDEDCAKRMKILCQKNTNAFDSLLSHMENSINVTQRRNSADNSLSWRSPNHSYVRQIRYGITRQMQDEAENSKNFTDSSLSRRDPYYSIVRQNVFNKTRRYQEKPENLENPQNNWRIGNSSNYRPFEGYWSFECDNELCDAVWQSLKFLFVEKPELFSREPEKFLDHSLSLNLCWYYAYKDKKDILNVSKIIRKNMPFYTYCIYFRSFQNGKHRNIYMNGCEGDVYEKRREKWVLIKF